MEQEQTKETLENRIKILDLITELVKLTEEDQAARDYLDEVAFEVFGYD